MKMMWARWRPKRRRSSVRWAASSGHRGRAYGELIVQQPLPGQSHFFRQSSMVGTRGGGGVKEGDQK